MRMKTLIRTGVLSAVAASAVVAATAPSASAYIACNRYRECWHVRTRYAYPPALGVSIYADSWRWRGGGWRWARDRDDRGYWYHGRWRRF
jgi:hypothetical protein